MTTDKTLSIEHYLPLYLGQECIHQSKPIIGNRFVLTIETLLEAKVCDCKLLLRPLMSITEDEKLVLFKLLYGEEDAYSAIRLKFALKTDSLNPESFKYLLSKGFDIFNLIPEGLALDTTTLKN